MSVLRLMMGMIGFTVGFIGFLLHNLIDCIEEPILERALGYVKQISITDFKRIPQILRISRNQIYKCCLTNKNGVRKRK